MSWKKIYLHLFQRLSYKMKQFRVRPTRLCSIIHAIVPKLSDSEFLSATEREVLQRIHANTLTLDMLLTDEESMLLVWLSKLRPQDINSWRVWAPEPAKRIDTIRRKYLYVKCSLPFCHNQMY